VLTIKVSIPIPLKYVNVYVLECEGGYALIDSGMASFESAYTLYGGLRSAGVQPTKITRVFLTHFHADHSTLAPLINKISNAEVYMGRREVEALRGSVEDFIREMQAEFKRQGAPGEVIEALGKQHPASRTAYAFHELFSMDIKLVDDGQELPCGLRAYWTPGHTPGHVVYKHDDVAFTGDHLLPEITSNISWFPLEGFDALGEYLSSLRKLIELNIREAYPAHRGTPIREVRERVEEMLRHHELRLEEVLKALHEPSTAYQVAKRISWRIGSFETFDVYNKIFAIGEALAHLVHLERLGRVERIEGDVVLWKRAI